MENGVETRLGFDRIDLGRGSGAGRRGDVGVIDVLL